MKQQYSVTVNRPAQEAFEYTSNYENVSTWQALVMNVRKTSDGPIGQGTTIVSRIKFLGAQFDVPTETTEWDPPRSFAVRNTGGPLPISMRFSFTPEGDSTQVTMDYEMDLGGLFQIATPLLEPVVRRQMQSDLDALKAVLESQPAAAPTGG